MGLYRKKPVVIEARQWTNIPTNTLEIERWGSGKIIKSPVLEATQDNPTGSYLQIHTLEGVMTAGVGDYIIKRIKGEFYPCKPDIFEQTYEKAE